MARPSSFFQPDSYISILGKTFVDRSHRPILALGEAKYDRYQLASMGIPHLKAARTLDQVLRRLGITDAPTLARRIHELPTIKGAGVATFTSALALLHDQGLAKPAVSTWNAEAVRVATKDQDPDTRVPVTVSTVIRRNRKPKNKKGKGK